MNRTQLGVFTLAAWMVAATAFGQAGAITEIKTPPMRDSDVITIPLRLHFPGDPTPVHPDLMSLVDRAGLVHATRFTYRIPRKLT